MDKIKSLLESAKYPKLTASETSSMKLMLENTNKEASKLIAEGTLSGDVAQFTPILLPLVRRVYPKLIANELLGVQPMSMPTGFIYALVNRYTGTGVNGATPNSNAVIIDFTLTPGDLTGGALSEGVVVTGNASGATGTVAVVDGTKALITNITGAFTTADTAATLTQADGVTPSTGTLSVNSVYTNEAAFGTILKGYTGPYPTSAAEVLSRNMREIGFTIVQKMVEAQSRALKGQYSVEMYQDLKAQHGLLADEEIMNLMSYEIQAEIDREVVDFINSNATQLPNTTLFSNTSTTDGGRWEIEKYRAQVIRVNLEAAQIGIDTKRGNGNVLIVSPKVAVMLEEVGSFKAAEKASSVTNPAGGGVAGVFDNRYKVVVDQYAISDYCTVLYKGADRRDAMGFFAPYVPLTFTKVTHPDTGQPAVIAKTRYALTTVPGISSANSNDRAALYARSFGIDFTNTVLGM